MSENVAAMARTAKRPEIAAGVVEMIRDVAAGAGGSLDTVPTIDSEGRVV
jgi:hypothetical protein